MNQIVYLLKVREEVPDTLTEEHKKDYECLCSTIHWQLLQADNLEFQVESVDVVLEDNWIYNYFKKHFNYETSMVNDLLLELMKVDLVEMGVKENG